MRYVVSVALLVVLAVVFGLAGMVMPMVDFASPEQSSSSSSSSDSVTHFVNPPTFDSGWVDIRDKAGQYFNVTHDLNTTEVVVDITGKQSFNIPGGALAVNETYGGAGTDIGVSVVETVDGGYAIAGYTNSFGVGGYDFWLVKTDSAGNMMWSRTYGGAGARGRGEDRAHSVVQTMDGGYAIVGSTNSYGSGSHDFWLVKTDIEKGLTSTLLTNSTITLYRGRTDPYWNYVRIRMWLIKEPTWMFGDINQDGVVDAKDLAIIGKNYGKTFSALSLGGIIAIATIYTYKKRKPPK